MQARTLFKGAGVVAALALAATLAWWLQRGPASDTSTAQPPAAAASKAAPAASGRTPSGPPSVEVVRVQPTRLVEEATAVGTLRSRQSVMLRPEVGGRVVQVAFADGATVRRGQLLLRLDDTLQQAELSQTQAQLSVARANHQRNQELVAQNFIARRVLDESQAALQVAQAQVQLAQARLARMQVVAPFDGVVGIRRVHLGDYVKDGADLVQLEDTSAFWVDFRLPERHQARVAIGQPVQLTLDALPGVSLSAKVQALDPLLEADGRALRVQAVLPAAKGVALKPGLFARVTLVLSTDDAALMVPEAAIVPQGSRQTLFTVADGVARRVEVQLGLRRNGQVQVLRGLPAAGAAVVVAGQQRLQKGGPDGIPVRVVDVAVPEAR